MGTETNGTQTGSAPIQDRREKPKGVLPRQMQMWLMVGIAVVILLIILMTGHQDPPAKVDAAERSAPVELTTPDKVRAYTQQLKDAQARLDRLKAQADEVTHQTTPANQAAPTTSDPVADDERRRDYQSLFADNVALSRRSGEQQPFGESGQRRGGSASTPTALSPDTLAVLALMTQASAANASRVVAPSVTTPVTTEHEGPRRQAGIERIQSRPNPTMKIQHRDHGCRSSKARSSKPCCSIVSTARSPVPSSAW